MAKGGAIGRVEAILGVVGVLALGVTYSIATGWNPLPAAQAWLDKHRTLAEPAPAWTVKVAEEPSGAGVAAGTVVVTAGGAATGYARPLSGANHTLVGIRPMSRTERGPLPVPALLGFPVNDEVQVIDTGAGTRVRTYRSGPMSWATVAATRVVVTSGNFRSGTCHLRTEGRDPAGDRQGWQRGGDGLHTGTELGCDQRTKPLRGGGRST